MKLHLTQAAGLHLITAYEDDYVAVNREKYPGNVLVLPEKVIVDWTQADSNSLSAESLQPLHALDVEVILLGTGPCLRFPPPELLHAFLCRGVGIEVMDRPAACRTYNILASEGRKVAAALLLA
ncbi:Mth938-like domain-containing protein [Azonexus sp.]|uniref:Mth938-like domain-containing protein n=1 Tax=Azonexus sp. TaxID=1872668 RepID=UPI0039E5CA1A